MWLNQIDKQVCLCLCLRDRLNKYDFVDKERTSEKMIISFGYLRCSTEEQNLDRQFTAIKKYRDIPEEYLFAEKITGKTDEREQYQAMKVLIHNLVNINSRKDAEQRDDIEVVIEELDRLGRTTKIIRDEMQWFAERGVKLRILEIPTTLMEIDENNDWVLEMVNRILIEVYTSIAQAELLKKEKRVREGIEAAKARGAYRGRKPIEVEEKLFVDTYKRWRAEEITARRAMDILDVKNNTFYRMVHDYEDKGFLRRW